MTWELAAQLDDFLLRVNSDKDADVGYDVPHTNIKKRRAQQTGDDAAEVS